MLFMIRIMQLGDPCFVPDRLYHVFLNVASH